MFFITSTECCNEMLHIYHTRGKEYALELGAPIHCSVVNSCDISSSDATTRDYKYYPDITSGKCYNDGKESEFQLHLYDTLSDCVSIPFLVLVFFGV